MNHSTKRTFPEIFSQLIEETQTHTGKGIVEIADDIGIAKSSLSAYANGKRNPRSDALLLIANYFHVSCDYLLGISDVSTQNVEVHEMCKQLGLSELGIDALRYLAHGDKEEGAPPGGAAALSFLSEIIPKLPRSYLCQEYYVLQQIRGKGVENQENDTRSSALKKGSSGHWWVLMFGGTAAKFIAREIGNEISEWLLGADPAPLGFNDEPSGWLDMINGPWNEND